VIYACENNLYNEYTHFSETTAGDIMMRATAFGVPAESVDGQDVLAVYAAAKRLTDRSRKGEGPAFLLCNTYRYTGHHVGDISREYYRSKQEERTWKAERDPIKNFAAWLTGQKICDAAALEHVQSKVAAEMESAVKFAVDAPYPEVQEVEQHVYAG